MRTRTSATVLIMLALAGCTHATLPEWDRNVSVQYTCPVGMAKVCEQPASELICSCEWR